MVYQLHKMRAQSVYCPRVVTAKTQYNLKNAREYFEEHICVGDYYNEGQRVAGEWSGLGAEWLGLNIRCAVIGWLFRLGNELFLAALDYAIYYAAWLQCTSRH